MDVSRAKTVIIVLLVAFNIFLLANNLVFHNAQGNSRETLENAKKILEQRGVKLECQIPVTSGTSHHRLEYLKGDLDRGNIVERLLGDGYEVLDDSVYHHAGREVIFPEEAEFVYTDSSALSNAINTYDEAKANEIAIKFMKENGLFNAKYVLDRFEKKDGRTVVLRYIEKYDGQLLFDNCFTIELSHTGVTRLEYQKYQIKGLLPEKIEQPEVYQTLLAYFKKDSNLVITSIDSGYKLTDETSVDTIDAIEPLLVLRVMIKGEAEPLYINPHDISL